MVEEEEEEVRVAEEGGGLGRSSGEGERRVPRVPLWP